VLDYAPGRDGALWVTGGPRAGKTTLLQNIVRSAAQLENAPHRVTPAGDDDGSWSVLRVPAEPALAWDVLVAAARVCDDRHTNQAELIIVDGLDAIVRSTPDDALDDLMVALERVAREGPGQGRFLVYSTSADEPSLNPVTRHVRYRIELGSRFPGRGMVGGDAVQLTAPVAFTPPDRLPLSMLSEALRGRRAVVLTNAPEAWLGLQVSDAALMRLEAVTPEQAITLSDEMRRRVREEPLVWHGVARMAARFVGRDVHRIPPPLEGSVVVLEADDTYVRATLPGTLGR
jgi:hypothetical protein